MSEKSCAKSCAFKTSVGGQAILEGVMMRGPEKIAMAVRKPDGGIHTEVSEVRSHAWRKWPLVRGVCSFVESLVTGYRYLSKSADIALTEAEEELTGFDKWVDEKFGEKGTNFVMGAASVLGIALAVALFVFLPTFLVGLIGRALDLGWTRTLLEGLVKVALLVGYLAAVSRMKEMKRLFGYHGAEHKTIACYEAGMELTTENIRTCSRFHPRCGTSFLLIVVLVSILVNAALPWSNLGLRAVYKLLLLPVVVGISYEIIKLCGRYDNPVTHAVSAPGLWLQHITTNEPDDSMIECAVAAIRPVLPENREEAAW